MEKPKEGHGKTGGGGGGASEFEAQTLMRHADPRSTGAYIHANVIRFRDIVNRRGKKPVDIGEFRRRR
jgi:hypothetical protein